MQTRSKRNRGGLIGRLRDTLGPEAALVGTDLNVARVDCDPGPPGTSVTPRVARPRPVKPHDASSARAALAEIERRASGVSFVTLPMLAADLLALAITCSLALGITTLFTHPEGRDFVAVSAALVMPIILGNLLTGLYPGAGSNPVVEFRQLSRVSAIAFVGSAALVTFGRFGLGWYLFFVVAWPLQFGLAPLTRAAARRLCCRYLWYGYPVIIFGAGRAATTVVMNLLQNPAYGLRPVVVLDPSGDSQSVMGLPVLATPRLAATAAKRLRIRHAIVALPDLSRQQTTRVLERYATGIRHVMITSAISPFSPGLPILWRDTRDLAGVAGVEVRNRLLVATPRLIKRTMDVLLTVFGGLCLLPLLAALAVAVKVSSPGPVVFSHTRIGHRGRRFKAHKFRSMVTDGDVVLLKHLAENAEARAEWERDHKLKNDPRVTRVGTFMRKTSLDELPQLWNVLRGEMSLVGPRPIVKAEIEKYGKCYSIYKSVRPGITGLWQVSGRNDTTYDERLKFDEFYVRNWSPWLDMHLLARTASALLGKGAY